MTRFYLLRHGETAWNVEKVFRGQAEVPLTDNGRTQARYAGEYLQDRGIQRIYSSPLLRAVETAQIAARSCGLKPGIDERLTGLNFGKWQGRPYREVEAEYPEMFKIYMKRPQQFRAPGGEGLEEAMKRALEFLEDTRTKYPEDPVVIVTHRVICKLMLLGIMGLTSEKFWMLKPDTCSISEFITTSRKTVLVKFNDTSFLGEAERITEDF